MLLKLAYFCSPIVAIFYLMPNVLYGAAQDQHEEYLLHKAIQNPKNITEISKLAALGYNPNIYNSEGRTAWQLIASYPGKKGYKRKSLRYAINQGLRLFLKENPNKRAIYLGDCGNPDCNLAEAALYLSWENNYKDREHWLEKAYKYISEQLKAGMCNNLDLHVFEGESLRDALLLRYCNPLQQNKKLPSKKFNPNEVKTIKNFQIQRINDYILELRDSLEIDGENSPGSKKRKGEIATITFFENEDACGCDIKEFQHEDSSDECSLCSHCGACSKCSSCTPCTWCATCPECAEDFKRSISIKCDYLEPMLQRSFEKLDGVCDTPPIIKSSDLGQEAGDLSYAELFSDNDLSAWFAQ